MVLWKEWNYVPFVAECAIQKIKGSWSFLAYRLCKDTRIVSFYRLSAFSSKHDKGASYGKNTDCFCFPDSCASSCSLCSNCGRLVLSNRPRPEWSYRRHLAR